MLFHRLETDPGSYLIEAVHPQYCENHKPFLKATFLGFSEVQHSQIGLESRLTYQLQEESLSGTPAMTNILKLIKTSSNIKIYKYMNCS